ncbi:hypothetical protein PUN28_012955 [Cardiocondyla obscurior]|uniref:Uncharacterized protein n=1 Tax=Cardiocondyla obscurior TaxID=286306 RepID=A0AAW2FB32_9HYME
MYSAPAWLRLARRTSRTYRKRACARLWSRSRSRMKENVRVCARVCVWRYQASRRTYCTSFHCGRLNRTPAGPLALFSRSRRAAARYVGVGERNSESLHAFYFT